MGRRIRLAGTARFSPEWGPRQGQPFFLMLAVGNSTETIRVYDSAHGHNEMHRYTRSEGKQAGTPFHSGTLGDGMRAAIEEIEGGFRQMIEGWERQ